jgi:hypothetical protein
VYRLSKEYYTCDFKCETILQKKRKIGNGYVNKNGVLVGEKRKP